MSEESLNYLIIMTGLLTSNNCFKKDNKDKECIQINWCSYDIAKRTVTAEASFLIRPYNIEEIDKDFLIENNINPYLLQNSENLADALERFVKLLKENFISRDLNIGIIAKDNWLINEYLYKDCLRKGVEFPQLFQKNLSLVCEFKNFYAIDSINEKEEVNVNDLLSHLSLKETESSSPSLKVLNTIARIVNRMIKDGYVFKQSSFQNSNAKKQNTNSAGAVDNKSKVYYLRFRNIPLYFSQVDFKNQFYSFTINDHDIAISYDIYGRKTGDFCLKIYNEPDFTEILTSFK
jgi:hypothetical protein